MTIAVTGAAGMLGHALVRVAGQEGVQVLGVVRRERQAEVLQGWGVEVQLADITDVDGVARVLDQGIDTLINCAGVTKALCNDPVEVCRINALAPHLLARACSRRQIRLIHVSTDCVFSGRQGNYSEEDTPDPVDLYGRSKLLGEVAYDGHLTVRTSFIGRELGSRHGLLEWFLASREHVDGYTRAFWSGLSSIALSRILLTLVRRPEVGGLLNVAGERVSKFAVLSLAGGAFRRSDLIVRAVEAPFLDRSLAAKRLAALGIVPPTLREMLDELASSEVAGL